MTEKRFVLVKCYNEQWGVVDKLLKGDDQLVLITTSKSGTGYLVNELNKLNEENERLKNKLKFFNELNEPYGTIIKENERLKKENKDLESFRHNVFKWIDNNIKYGYYLDDKYQNSRKKIFERPIFNCSDEVKNDRRR